MTSGTQEADDAHRSRQLDHFIAYVENNPEETLEDIIQHADIRYSRDPKIKAALTSGDSISKVATILSVLGGTLASFMIENAPANRDDEKGLRQTS